MSSFNHPSALFPARPPFTVEVEDGWDVMALPGAEFAAVKDGSDGFRSVFTVAVNRVPGAVAVDDVFDGLTAQLSSFPGFRRLGRKPVELLGEPATLLEFTHAGEQGNLFQSVRVAVVPAGLSSDVMTVTGVCPARDLELVEQVRLMCSAVTSA